MDVKFFNNFETCYYKTLHHHPFSSDLGNQLEEEKKITNVRDIVGRYYNSTEDKKIMGLNLKVGISFTTHAHKNLPGQRELDSLKKIIMNNGKFIIRIAHYCIFYSPYSNKLPLSVLRMYFAN